MGHRILAPSDKGLERPREPLCPNRTSIAQLLFKTQLATVPINTETELVIVPWPFVAERKNGERKWGIEDQSLPELGQCGGNFTGDPLRRGAVWASGRYSLARNEIFWRFPLLEFNLFTISYFYGKGDRNIIVVLHQKLSYARILWY